MLRTRSQYRTGARNMASSDLSDRASHMQQAKSPNDYLSKVSYCELQWPESRQCINYTSVTCVSEFQPSSTTNSQVDKHIEIPKVSQDISDLRTTYISWIHSFSIQIPSQCQVRPVQRCAHISWVGAPSSSLATSVLHGWATALDHDVIKDGNIINE